MNETQTLISLRTVFKSNVWLRVKPISNKLVMNADPQDALNPWVLRVQPDDIIGPSKPAACSLSLDL